MKANLKNKRRRLVVIFSVIALVTLLLISFICACIRNGGATVLPLPKDGVSFVFLSVGQASCTMIFTDGGLLLIDTGSNSSESSVLSALSYYGAEEIHSIVLTHADEDHTGGLDAILNAYPVKNVILTENTYGELSKAYEGLALEKAVSENRSSLILTTKGDVFSFGSSRLEVLVPSDHEDALLEGGNEASLILLFEFKDTRAIFTGDAGEAGEILAISALATSHPKINYDLLLVGHHGSSSSSSESFIEYISPRFAVISCDENNTYGHPSITVLNRLQKVGSKILRTDREGTVIFSSDGKTMRLISPE